MPVYRAYRVAAPVPLSRALRELGRTPKLKGVKSGSVSNEDGVLTCSWRDEVEIGGADAEESVRADLHVAIRAANNHHDYLLVGLAGRGLLGVRPLRYIADHVLPVAGRLIGRNGSSAAFESFEYTNRHFGKKYWGGAQLRLRSQYGYRDGTYLRVSKLNLQDIVDHPNESELGEVVKFIQAGSIRKIKGTTPELVNPEDPETPQQFTFDRQGILRCEFFDIAAVDDLVGKLMGKGFFALRE